MPIYEYCCEDCGHRFEELVMTSNGDEGVGCPECDSSRIKRLFSGFSFKSAGSTPASVGGKSCGPCTKTSCSSCG